MINSHPDSRLMNEYSAGTLPLAQSTCVSLHLNYCEHCQRQSQQLQNLGASLFEDLAPAPVEDGLLDAVLAQLDDQPPLSYGHNGSSQGEFPGLVHRLMDRNYDELEWNRVSSGLRVSRLRTGDLDNELALYHIKAGGKIPQHTHRGTELTLVLDGSFSDEEGVYSEGDFLMRDGEHVHTPTAAQTSDCICIGVLDAPIRFTRWNYRVLNPFLKIQAH